MLGKMIKRYKKALTPTLQTADKFKIFGFLIKNVVVNLKWRAKFTLGGCEWDLSYLWFLQICIDKNKI